MVYSKTKITPLLSNSINLIMTDVDDTITTTEGGFSDSVKRSLEYMQQSGIPVGLISGRTMANLQACALELNINGPLVAENGGQIRLSSSSQVITLGNLDIVSQNLDYLKNQFPGAIKDGDWNKERLTDRIIGCNVQILPDISKHLIKTDIIETGYSYLGYPVSHLVEKGINKGTTLLMVLRWLESPALRPETTLVFGDGPNDIPMFELFPHSVLIPNKSHPAKYQEQLNRTARYMSELSSGDGFVEIARQVLEQRY